MCVCVCVYYSHCLSLNEKPAIIIMSINRILRAFFPLCVCVCVLYFTASHSLLWQQTPYLACVGGCDYLP